MSGATAGTTHPTTPTPSSKRDRSWRAAVAPYEKPDLRKSLFQIATSVLPYLAVFYVSVRALEVSFWLSLAITPLAAGFLVRTFIIAHDCGHGSFFRNRRANDIVGFIASTLAFTPYGSWRFQHAVHHASAGDLDHRDLGDVWTLTVAEYESASLYKRLSYRLYRNPFIMFTVGPFFQFFIASRFWRTNATPREKRSIVRTNLALAAIAIGAWTTIGIDAYLLVQVPVMMLAGTAGVWLFYVQHNFEDAYWDRHEEWDYVREALAGSSFYDLPPVLRWFSGNIGYHHVHHLSPRIPSYHLPACSRHPLFDGVPRLTLTSAFSTLRCRLYDEEARRMIGFGDVRSARAS